MYVVHCCCVFSEDKSAKDNILKLKHENKFLNSEIRHLAQLQYKDQTCVKSFSDFHDLSIICYLNTHVGVHQLVFVYVIVNTR